MESLKEIRERLGILAVEVSRKTNISTPVMSTYELGTVAPELTDALLIERTFGTRLDWSLNEKIEPEARQKILACINKLADNYPLETVLRFTLKYLKEGLKYNSPDKFIVHFTQVSEGSDVEVMMPTSKL